MKENVVEVIKFLEDLTTTKIIQLTAFFGIIVSIYVDSKIGIEISVITLIYAILNTHVSKIFVSINESILQNKNQKIETDFDLYEKIKNGRGLNKLFWWSFWIQLGSFLIYSIAILFVTFV